MPESQEKFSIRLNVSDRPFLDAEALRLMRERFEETRELHKPSLADVVTELLEELRDHRSHADRCPHQSSGGQARDGSEREATDSA